MVLRSIWRRFYGPDWSIDAVSFNRGNIKVALEDDLEKYEGFLEGFSSQQDR